MIRSLLLVQFFLAKWPQTIMEQSKNYDVIKSKEAEVDELNKTLEKDKKRFENLGLELKNFSDRQGHFQEEKEVKNAEANLVAGHILNLDMKLAGSDKLHEKNQSSEGRACKVRS